MKQTVFSRAQFIWQIILAGLFVSGDVERLKDHSANADMLATTMTVAMAIAAVFAWFSRGARWPFVTIR